MSNRDEFYIRLGVWTGLVERLIAARMVRDALDAPTAWVQIERSHLADLTTQAVADASVALHQAMQDQPIAQTFGPISVEEELARR